MSGSLDLSWQKDSACGQQVNEDFRDFFFSSEPAEKYQAKNLCFSCPVRKECFSVGISGKEWGVWGGVYLENGEISKEFSSHKSKNDWGLTWQSLTME